MAENRDGQEKTEQPTAKRLDDARRKGQVARSRELNTVAITLIGVVVLVMMSSGMGEDLGGIMKESFSLSRAEVFDTNSMLRHLSNALAQAVWMLLPFFAAVIAAAIVSSIALGGMAFSTETLAPKLSKLDPIKGMKRVFSVKGLVELLKALAKFVLIGGVTALLLWILMGDFMALNGMDLKSAVSEMGSLLGWSLLLLASTLILVAAIDVPFQLWEHKRQLRMTKQEVREEMKDTDGRPEVKGRIRSLQRELAQRRMMEEVPKADVIVTNPTHYAIALRYDQGRMQAPKVVAKGTELVAANIRRVGSEAGVPVVESPLLARALYFNTDIGEYIPAGLYLAVAKLLAYVFQLKVYRRDGGERPQPPTDLPVPDEFRTE